MAIRLIPEFLMVSLSKSYNSSSIEQTNDIPQDFNLIKVHFFDDILKSRLARLDHKNTFECETSLVRFTAKLVNSR